MDLFRRARTVEKPETREEAVARLRDTVERMKARQAVLEAKVNAEAQNARQNCQRDKRTALAALKRRRSYQTQQSKTEEMRVAIEAQLSAIESSNHGQTLVELASEPLAPAAASSPSMTDSVEDIMEQIREEIDSIDQFFSLPTKPLEYVIDNDDELEAELDALTAEASEDVASPAVTRPAATHRQPTPRQWQNLTTQDELDELAALEEAMAM